MAAYINRTLSSGPQPQQPPMPVNGLVMMSMMTAAPQQPAHHHHLNGTPSPLQIFVNAKKQINDIFTEIDDYVNETVLYMRELDAKILTEEEMKVVEGYVAKIRGIREVLKRDHMKVAFFGRTSNGKSTVINAMLRDKILPSGIGHTTNCFLQVEGSDDGESYLVTEGSSERKNVQSVAQLGHALCKEKLSESQLVRIFWPRDKCLLLRDDVVLVDSPGIDVTPNLDEWIDKHCLDADVFVLVANAESTLMVTEKNFFHKVSTRLSKPNIFILNNRWDASASEPEFLDGVRGQHLERAIDFLVKELKVCSQKEAQERIFFVSAKEALQARLQEQKGLSAHTGALAEGFPKRYFEFQDFEKKFEECISKSAVKTKFEQHLQRGKFISEEIRHVMETIYETALKLKSERTQMKKEFHEKLNFTEQQLLLITQEMKNKIHLMVEDVEQKVSKALNEEIRRLAVLVDEFNLSFHPDPLVLNVYKKELHGHVESGLGSNLRARLSTALALNIEQSQREMTDRMAQLLPPERRQLPQHLLPRREPFEILYRLNCDNLCADFHEDLQFRFSWGLVALVRRWLGNSSTAHRINLVNYRQVINNGLPTPDGSYDVISTPTASTQYQPYSNLQSSRADEYFSVVSKVALASISSQGTMGGLLFAGFMLKTVGWRLIAVTGAIYGTIYLYERLTWTNKAKERAFKKQYVEHATKKLKLIVDLTSANCSHQVQQELSTTFARLCHLVDDSTNEMDQNIKGLETEIKMLENAGNAAKVLRNKANYVMNELDLFEEKFLK